MPTELEDLKILKTSEQISDALWKEVSAWKYFEKKVVGEQLIRAADSIGANIAESYGRYHYGDKLKFLFYARGSLYETKYWLNLSSNRNLIAEATCSELAEQLGILARQINAFSNSLREQKVSSLKIKENSPGYVGENNTENPVFSQEEILSISNPKSLVSGVPGVQ